MLPKDHPGVEQRNVTHDARDGRPLHSCTVSVDGKTAITITVTNIDPKHLSGGVTANPEDFIAGGGVGASAAGAVVMDYCPGNRSLVATASVSLDSGLRPAPGDDQEPAKRALTQLAKAVLAAQSHEVC